MSDPKRLRDCRGFVDLINELCTCGGNDRANGCDACKIYHAIGDWLTVEAPAPGGRDWKAEVAVLAHALGIEYVPDTGGTWPGELDSMLNRIRDLYDIEEAWTEHSMGELESLTVAPVEKMCGTCGWCGPMAEDKCEAPVPLSVKDPKKTIFAYGDVCPCWKAKS